MVTFCVGKDSCRSQAMNEGSKSILVLATLQSLFVATTERLSPVNSRAMQCCISISSCPCAIKSAKSHEKMYQALQCKVKHTQESGDEASPLVILPAVS